MDDLEVTIGSRAVARRRIDVRVISAFFAIYVLWGATFLAIRIAVQLIPPFFTAGLRFFIAGTLLYGFMRLRGQPAPSFREWRSLAVMGLLMFVATYGALFWGEQYVPSGITSVLEASLPVITISLEVFVLRRQALRWPMLAAVVSGFCGVAMLLMENGRQSFGLLPCAVILAGGTAWSLGAVLTRSMPLPVSRPLTAGAAMMLGGGILLVLSGITGELHPFPHIPLRAALALLYLIVGGSLVAFTAFVWLLARMPATKVASHAYVNPLVAVALGYFAAGEIVTLRTVLAAALVMASVFLILKNETAVASPVRHNCGSQTKIPPSPPGKTKPHPRPRAWVE
jgi:drug/metabolite transporter (DMT)-like permease